MSVNFSIGSASDLSSAISAISSGGASFATSTDYIFTFASPGLTVSLAAALADIALGTGSTLLINGRGGTLDGGGLYQGLFVASGSVTIADLTMSNLVATGGRGGDGSSAASGGGGLGAGGALFVAAGAAVTLDGVGFIDNAAQGGAGGNYDRTGAGGQGTGGALDGRANHATGFGVGGSGSADNQYGGVAGGFGGGTSGGTSGSTGNGADGGQGDGGAIFVQQGGTLSFGAGTVSGGSVTGGAGGTSGFGSPGNAGSAAGAGIYIQTAGTTAQTIDLAPGLGLTLTLSDAIGGSGGVHVTGGGTVIFAAANTYLGTTSIDAASTLRLTNAAALATSSGVTIAAGATLDSSGLTITLGGLDGDGVAMLAGSDLSLTLAGTHAFAGTTDAPVGTLSVSGTGEQDFASLAAASVNVSGATLGLTGSASLAGAIILSAGGTLKLANGAASSVSAIDFAGSGATLAVSGSVLPAGVLSGFGPLAGTHPINVIDLAGYTAIAATASLDASSILHIPTTVGTLALTLDPAQTYTTDMFVLGADAGTGTLLSAVQTAYSVAAAADLADAIAAINAYGVTGVHFTITFAADIVLGGQLPSLAIGAGNALSINGAGYTLDGVGLYRGFFVRSGSIDIANLTIAHAAAQGGAASPGGTIVLPGGGGLGAGGGLFVAAGASVNLENVAFATDTASGGAGGAYTSSINPPGRGAGGAFDGDATLLGGSFGAGGVGGAVLHPTAPGFGGGNAGSATPSGSQGNGGDGGQAYGGAVFVQSGGTLTYGSGNVANSSLSGGVGGTSVAALSGTGQGATGATAGAGIYAQGLLSFAPGAGETLTLSDAIAGAAVTIGGAGTVVYAAANTYSASTSIGSGTLLLAATGSLPTASALSIANGATFDSGGSSVSLASLSGAGAAQFGAATLTVANTGTASFTGSVTAGAVVMQGSGLARLTGPVSANSATIASGTLELSGSTASIGVISFTGSNRTLRLDGTIMPSAAIAGFAAPAGGTITGNVIDLPAFVGTGAASLVANNLLHVPTTAGTLTLQLAQGVDDSHDVFTLASDGAGGTKIYATPEIFNVANASDLATAITSINAAGLTGITYTIDLAANITLSAQLPVIAAGSGNTIDLVGAGNTIDGAGLYQGLFVQSGSVALSDLTIAHALARGGDGGGGGFVYATGGGGLGAGGGLFVSTGASVSISGVGFVADAAAGGAGGNYTRSTFNTGTAGLFEGRSDIPASFGTFGAGGVGAAGGFGGGAGGSFANNQGAGGGGGQGDGGAVFVQQGGALTLLDGNISGNTSTGGAAGTSDYGAAGAAGIGAGAGLFVQGKSGVTQTVTLAPGSGQTLDLLNSIADGGGAGAILIAGAGVVVLGGSNTYTGGTDIQTGTLRLTAGGTLPGTGTVTIASGATLDGGGGNFTVGALAGTGLVEAGTGTLSIANSGTLAYGGSIDAAGIAIQSSGLAKLTGALSAASVAIGAGTLELGANSTTPGAIGFTGSQATLRLDGTLLPAIPITGFGVAAGGAETGNVIDLAGYSPGAGATLDAGNVLHVQTTTGTVSLQLTQGVNYSADTFKLTSDGAGGTDITAIQTLFAVGDQAGLAAAITAIDTAGLTGLTYTIDLTGNITLASQLPVITAGANTIDLIGGGYTLDGAGAFQGLFVQSGSVALSGLTIAHAVARGGNGTGAGNPNPAGGGGLGAGGGLFIASGASVSASGISFLGNAAIGGAGGSYARLSGASGTGGAFEGRSDLPTSFGTFGAGGLGATNNSFGGAAGGFGGGVSGGISGSQGSGGGGGQGDGGAVFIEQGGALTLLDGSITGNTSTGGAGGSSDFGPAGPGGTAAGAGLFMQGTNGVTQFVTLAPAAGQTLDLLDGIADGGGAGAIVVAGAGVVVLGGSNAYTGGTAIDTGTLRLASGASLPNTGTVTIAAGATLDSVGGNLGLNAIAGNGLLEAGTGTLSIANSGTMAFGGSIDAAALSIQGNGLVKLTSALSAASAVIGSGTLEIAGSGNTLAALSFSGHNTTLRLDGSVLSTPTINGFGVIAGGTATGNVIDLAGYAPGAGATLDAGNVLHVQTTTGTVALQLTPGADYSADTFLLTGDGSGGTDISSVPNIFSAANQAGLAAAITAIDTAGGTGLTYTIDLTANITLTSQLPVITAGGNTIDLIGGGYTLDGGGAYQGLFVQSGSVALSGLTIAHAVARGGNGGNGSYAGPAGGGGLGAGGALFVASAASVSISGVSLTGNSALGGVGGAYVFTSGASGSAGSFEGRGTLAAAFGSFGTGGLGATNNSFGGAAGGFGGGVSGGKAGSQGSGGGGGQGDGGAVFVQQGGALTLLDGNISGNTSTGGAGGTSNFGPAGTAGTGAGAGLFIQGKSGVTQTVTLAPGAGQTLDLLNSIADGGGAGAILVAGAGVVVLGGSNSYTGGTRIQSGTIRLATGGTLPGTGTITIASGATLDSGGANISLGAFAGTGLVQAGTGTLSIASSGTMAFAGAIDAAAVAIQSSGLVQLSGALSIASLAIGTGTLELGANSTTLGAIGFTGSQATLRLDGTLLPSVAITGFGVATGGTVTGNVIDLAGYSPGAGATLDAGNVLHVQTTTGTVSLQLTQGVDYSADVFALTSDGAGGTDIVATPTLFTVGDQAGLAAAITAIDTVAATGLTYTIDLTGNITLASQLPVITAGANTIDLIGGGHTLDGGGAFQGLFVQSGSVALSGLTIAHAVARGGNGTAGSYYGLPGGGGLGAGGGLFIASGASVSTSGVNFLGNAAIGGAGGAFSSSSGASGSGGSFEGRTDLPASLGSFGEGGGAAANGFGGGPVAESYNGVGGGGGGQGDGGAVFVQQGGALTLLDGTISGNTSTGGAGGSSDSGPTGPTGETGGAGLFIQGTTGVTQTVTLAPGAGQTLDLLNSIADGGGAGAILVAGAGVVVLGGSNTYTGGTDIQTGTLRLTAGGTLPGTGTVTIASGATLDGGGGNFTVGALAGTGLVQAGTGTLSIANSGTMAFAGAIDAAGVAIQSSGLVQLTGALSIASLAIGTGTLELGANSATPGAIGFTGSLATLRLDGTVLPSVAITGFGVAAGGAVTGNVIDLAGYSPGAGATLDAGNVLRVQTNTGTVSLQLTQGVDYSADVFALTSDGAGGTDIVATPTLFTVGDQAGLATAITAIDTVAATGLTYTIDLTGNITLASQLPVITAGANTIDLIGGGYTLDGGGAFQGLFVQSGSVALSGLTIAHAVARGGDGAGGSYYAPAAGGGLGAGGGLFIASGASVSASAVNFTGNAAIGGAGGAYVAYSFTYGSGGSFEGRADLPASLGTFGVGGVDPSYSTMDGAPGGFGGGLSGGQANNGGGGGEGDGGAIFVQQGGALTLLGGTFGGNASTGGAGGTSDSGPSGAAGAANGAGLFIQGADGVTQTVTLAPTAGQTLDLPDSIADGGGPGGLLLAGAGVVMLGASNTYTGGTTLGSGTLELATGSSAGTGPINFAHGSTGTLKLDGTTAGAILPGVPLLGLAVGDEIDLAGVPFDAAGSTTIMAGNTLALTSGGTLYTLALDPAQDLTGLYFNPGNATLSGASGTVITVSDAPCYCPGTRIRTQDGDVQVEALCVGDLVLTASGQARAIRWIGERSYQPGAAAGDPRKLPVVIAAGALADQVPERVLRVSPEHKLLLDGVLVPAIQLVNGASIRQPETSEAIRYLHIQLDDHDILLAEGAPAESFIDDGGSAGLFDNAATRPPVEAMRFCAPVMANGAALEGLRRRLAARAARLRPDGTAAPARLQGHLDRVQPERLTGWAFDPDAPDEAVTVLALINGAEIARARADRPRPDLARAGFGDGCHGFDLALPPGLGGFAVELRSLADLSLPNGTTILPAPPLGALRGTLEHVSATRVTGWALEDGMPERPVGLVIVADGEPIARVVANRYRADLAAAGLGSGRHAFDVTLPTHTAREIAVRREVDGSELPGSPIRQPGADGPGDLIDDVLADMPEAELLRRLSAALQRRQRTA